jgi:hypothetical protein
LTGFLNDHLLVAMLLDVCNAMNRPTLLQGPALGRPTQLFRSMECLATYSEVYDATRVDHAVLFDVDFDKPVRIAA